MYHSKCCNTSVSIGGKSTTHFFICDKCGKACDIADKDPVDLIHKQIELINKFWPQMIDEKNKQNSSNTMILSIIGELSEMMEGYKALPWKPEREERDYILEEITDVLHFVLELYIIWGVKDWQEVEDLYLKKRKKNIDRGEIHKTHSNDLPKE